MIPSGHKDATFLLQPGCESRSAWLPHPDEMPFLNGRKGSDTGNEGYGTNGPEHHRNCNEEQEPCQSVGRGVGEAEAFADYECRHLINKFDYDNQSCPDPQPRRDLHNGDQPYCTASDKADVRHAVQHGTGLALGVQFPRQIPIDHITDAAETIDYPKSGTCRMTEQQTGGPKESDGSYYVGDVFQFLFLFFSSARYERTILRIPRALDVKPSTLEYKGTERNIHRTNRTAKTIPSATCIFCRIFIFIRLIDWLLYKRMESEGEISFPVGPDNQVLYSIHSLARADFFMALRADTPLLTLFLKTIS